MDIFDNGRTFFGSYVQVRSNIESFCKDSKDNIDKGLRAGVTRAVNEIAEKARMNLISRLAGATKTLPEGGTLYQGIVAFAWKDGKPSATTHVYGNMKVNDGTYKLRFFEGGTKKRYQKKTGRYTGKIEGKWFFRDAVSAVEPGIEDNLMKYITSQIEKSKKTIE